MFKKSLTLLFLGAALLFGGEVTLKEGTIQAHTEVFGDTTIDPSTQDVQAKLEMYDTFNTMHGMISFPTTSLKSDNAKRDAHMQETLASDQYKTISYQIEKMMELSDGSYEIMGLLTLHGETREVSSKAKITQQQGNDILTGDFSFLMTEFGIEPPKLLFLTVRDQVDIKYRLTLQK